MAVSTPTSCWTRQVRRLAQLGKNATEQIEGEGYAAAIAELAADMPIVDYAEAVRDSLG